MGMSDYMRRLRDKVGTWCRRARSSATTTGESCWFSPAELETLALRPTARATLASLGLVG